MTDDQHHGAPGTPGAWEPIAPGDYEDATGFVELPDELMGGYPDADTPLAAPGHGYVPPPISVTPAAGGSADPAGTDVWGVSGTPAGDQSTGGHGVPGAGHHDAGQPGTVHPEHADPTQPGAVHWPDPNGLPPQDASGHPGAPGAGPSFQDPYGYDPGMTQTSGPAGSGGTGGPWHFDDAAGDTGAAPAGHGEGAGADREAGAADAQGGWSIPLAQGDLPDETGEFTTSVLAAQWGGVPPATLPGGATAPWATGTQAGRPWEDGPSPQDDPTPQEPTQAQRMQQGVRVQRAGRAEPEYPAEYRDESGEQTAYHDESGQHAVHPYPEQAAGPHPAAPGQGADEQFQQSAFQEQHAHDQHFHDQPFQEGPFPEQPHEEHFHEERFQEERFQEGAFHDQPYPGQPFQEHTPYPAEQFADQEGLTGGGAPEAAPDASQGRFAGDGGHAPFAGRPDAGQGDHGGRQRAEGFAPEGAGITPDGQDGDEEDIYLGPPPAAPHPDTGAHGDAGPHPAEAAAAGAPFEAAPPRAPGKRRPTRRPLQDTRVQEPFPEELPQGTAQGPADRGRAGRAAERPRADRAARDDRTPPQANEQDHTAQEAPGADPGAPSAPAPEEFPQEGAHQGAQEAAPGSGSGDDRPHADGADGTSTEAFPGQSGAAPGEAGAAPSPEDHAPDSGAAREAAGEGVTEASAPGSPDDPAQAGAEEPAGFPERHPGQPQEAPATAQDEPAGQQDAGHAPDGLDGVQGDGEDAGAHGGQHDRRDARQDGGPDLHGDRPDDGHDTEGHLGDPDEEAAFASDEHPLGSYVLRVNGTDRPVTDAWIGESLLYVLRERLGLAGAKDGCSQGECGACNVQVDGRLVASCLVPAALTAGSDVRTVEGLAEDGQPSDVQRALAECGAVQCGFCVPGMAMTVHHLLEGNPDPTDLEARHALAGNLCRCSGYRGVLDAVRRVVGERRAAGSDGADTAPDEDTDTSGARIPHQASPGAGGVSSSVAYAARTTQAPYRDAAPYATSYDQVSYEDDGGRA